MTLRRGFLNLGVFLVATGGVILLVQSDAIAEADVTRALSLWPLAVIAIGVALVARRTRFSLPAGVTAALMPGLLLGGMLVSVPSLPSLGASCGHPANVDGVTRQGSFGSNASVDLELACGELTVSTAPGSAWQLDAADGSNGATNVEASSDRLSVRTTGGHRSFATIARGDTWHVTLPTDPTLDLDATISAGKGRLDLTGARIGDLTVEVNAGEARVDLGGASVSRLDVQVNAGSASVRLPAANLTGEVRVSAGAARVCAPDGLGLRVHGDAVLGANTYNGLVRRGDAWETPDYSTATYRADLTISSSVGSVAINPERGCL